MALLDRLKLRVETDLTDTELQLMIDADEAEIVDRYGAITEITILEDGQRHFITVHRRIDETETITITEVFPSNTGASGNRTLLSSDDFRITNGGRSIVRLIDGTNGRRHWSDLVEFKYTPVSDQTRRDEVVIKLATLSITYQGLDKQERTGDFSRGGSVTADAYTKEREALFNTLAPRGRLVMA